MQLLKTLKNSKTLALALTVAAGLFYLNYLTMSRLPGTDGYQCIMGAGLNAPNIVFSLVMSAAAGIIAAAVMTLTKNRLAMNSLKIGSASTVGLFIGTLTTFCTLCTLPVISLFGIGFSLEFITDYQVLFKIVSLGLLTAGLILINKQLAGHCACALPGRSQETKNLRK